MAQFRLLKAIDSPMSLPMSQGSSPKSTGLSSFLSSEQLVPISTQASLNRRSQSGQFLTKKEKFTSPLARKRLEKGIELFNKLFPQPVVKVVVTPAAPEEGSKLIRSLARPMKKSILLKRSSLKPGDSQDVMSQIRKIILAKEKEPLFPLEQISDVERLYAETKDRTKRRLKRSQPATQPSSPIQSHSPSIDPSTPSCPGSPVRVKTRPLGPKVVNPQKVRYPCARALVVDLPLLPFSQHSSYNQEKDFVRRHFRQMRDDSRNIELEKALFSRNKRLDTKIPLKEATKLRHKYSQSS